MTYEPPAIEDLGSIADHTFASRGQRRGWFKHGIFDLSGDILDNVHGASPS